MKIKIGIFFGGKSVEHEISIITAMQAIENIDKEKYEIIPIYITKDNRMYCGQYIGNINEYKKIDNLLHISTQITLAKRNNKVVLLKCNKKFYESSIYDYIDIAFPIVHGTNVEDGTLQGYLNMFDIPYVGCDVLSSAVCMDKYTCKCILKDNNIPVLNSLCFNLKDYDTPDKIINDTERNFSYPVIVKPINLGSSIGIEVANNKIELEDAIITAFSYSKRILIEKKIQNLKEINCSVIGDFENAYFSELEVPIKTDNILSFNDKYIYGSKKTYTININSNTANSSSKIDKELKKTIEDLSIKTFKILGCSGIVRIDYIIDQDSNSIYVNEINTIPGSLSFHLWKNKGISYKNLLEKLINLSLKKHREEKNITYSFDNNILSNFSLNGIKSNKLH